MFSTERARLLRICVSEIDILLPFDQSYASNSARKVLMVVGHLRLGMVAIPILN